MNTRKGNVSKATPQLESYIDDIPLDQDTPYGLFETNRGDRYVVSHHEGRKIAIVLRHHTERPFEWQFLSKTRIAMGDWLGDCEIELVHRNSNRRRSPEIGTLGIDEFGASLHCHPGEDECFWMPLGAIPYSQPMTDYDGWRILKNGRVFFEQLPHRASWQKVLPVAFTPQP